MSLRKYRLSVGVENVHSVIPGMQMEKLYGRVRRSCLAPMKAMWRFAGSTTKKENCGSRIVTLTKRLVRANITSVMMKNKQETIEKIKQAALEEFYANGYAKASLRTICRRAGVTKDSESVLKK